jgi:hypothetical protein
VEAQGDPELEPAPTAERRAFEPEPAVALIHRQVPTTVVAKFVAREDLVDPLEGQFVVGCRVSHVITTLSVVPNRSCVMLDWIDQDIRRSKGYADLLDRSR